MAKSKDPSIVHAGEQIKEQILYAPEYREIIPKLFKDFKWVTINFKLYEVGNFSKDIAEND